MSPVEQGPGIFVFRRFKFACNKPRRRELVKVEMVASFLNLKVDASTRNGADSNRRTQASY